MIDVPYRRCNFWRQHHLYLDELEQCPNRAFWYGPTQDAPEAAVMDVWWDRNYDVKLCFYCDEHAEGRNCLTYESMLEDIHIQTAEKNLDDEPERLPGSHRR